MMHAINGGWVGQTFALAKCSASEGKKSRIRRSKEERKAMVESFVKKYQTLNNGNFPSLNLTHKEVGGSFYTVREIVREIIQENRVLGPAKFLAEDLNINQVDDEYPLGTISTEPQTPSSITSNGSPSVPSHQEDNNEEQVLLSDGFCGKHESEMFDNEKNILASQVALKIEETAKSAYEELQTSKAFETVKSVERLAASTAKVTPIIADVEVETFPLRPVPKTADCSSATSAVKNSVETSEKEIEKTNLDARNGSVPSDQLHSLKNSVLVDIQDGTILAGVTLDKNPDLVNDIVVEKIADPQLKTSDCSTMEGGTVPDTVAGKNSDLEVSPNDVLTSKMNEENQRIDRTKEINAPNGKVLSASSSRQESKTPKAKVLDEAGVLNYDTSQNGSYPTVDRINLESWERESRNSAPAEMETNPLVAIFKSFVTAFMKLWSE